MTKITSQRLSKRLLQYGAMSAAMTGITDANGQIIHTDVDPDFGGAFTGYVLDVDNNTEADFFIFNSSTSSINYLRMYPIQFYEGPGNAVSASSFGFIYPKVLSSGQVISAGNVSWDSNYSYMDLNWGSCNYANSNWCNIENGFLGLRFLISGATHYGWAKLDVINSSNWLIKEYAYNATPDAPINAGQTTLGIADNLFAKTKVIALSKSIGIYNLQESTAYNVLNMAGQRVLNGNTNGHDYVIEAPTLASGVYIVELTDTKSDAVMRKKVVLQ